MATTATITPDSYREACAECADAINAEDWSLAWKKYAVAEAILGGLPQWAEQQMGGKIRMRESLDGLRLALKGAESAVNRNVVDSRIVTTRMGY